MIKTKTLSLLLFLIISISSHANLNDEMKTIGNQMENKKNPLTNSLISGIKKNAAFGKAQHHNLLQQLHSDKEQRLKAQNQGGKPADGAILFVSFSMPVETILTLSEQAASFDIPVVLKGLVDGDFKKTLEKIALLHEKASKSGIRFNGFSIDPIWFEQFEIKTVPTLVVTKRPSWCEAQKACANQPFDAVSGNVRIKKSLEVIAEKGENVPLVAKAILERHHV